MDKTIQEAELLVFTGHYVGEYHASPAVQNFALFRWGWTGVDLFFVLSGLLIGSQLWKELDRTGRIRIGHFLLRRGLRIWPLYYAFVVFTLMTYFPGRDLTGIWHDMTFLSNFFHHQVSGGWSLSTEEQFYILAPLLLSLFAIKLPPRRLWIAPILALVALVSARAWVSTHSVLPEPALRTKLYYPIFTHADGFAIGVLLAWLSVFYKDRLRSKVFSAGLLLLCLSAVWLCTKLTLCCGTLRRSGLSTAPWSFMGCRLSLCRGCFAGEASTL